MRLEEIATEPIYLEAKKKWGAVSQILAAAEELAEASACLTRFVNGKIPKEEMKRVLTELADAEIMLEQMRYYFDSVEIDREKAVKLERLIDRLGMGPVCHESER